MTTEFTHAIVRRPCEEMIQGLTSSDLGIPDFALAQEQHAHYIKSLEKCGLEIKVLEADSRFPDSCFIEDVALCTPKCAIITNPGASSRRRETDGMKEILQSYYKHIERIESPGTVEAGDIMMVGDHYYIGISARTNIDGADQMIRILEKYEMSGSKVPLKEVLHLKTGLSYLENNNLLISGEFVNDPRFESFTKIVIDSEEAYAVNSVWVNGNVIVPAGFPETTSKIEKAGYNVLTTPVSEFQKLDGGLSCLSLRF